MTGLGAIMAVRDFFETDILIIAATERAGYARIISEDLNSGQSYHGIAVVDPF